MSYHDDVDQAVLPTHPYWREATPDTQLKPSSCNTATVATPEMKELDRLFFFNLLVYKKLFHFPNVTLQLCAQCSLAILAHWVYSCPLLGPVSDVCSMPGFSPPILLIAIPPCSHHRCFCHTIYTPHGRPTSALAADDSDCTELQGCILSISEACL